MVQWLLFQHVHIILRDLRFLQNELTTELSDEPYFVGVTILFSADYSQLLPVVPPRRPEEKLDGSIRMIPVNLLDELPWRSTLWEKLKVLRVTEQVRQSQYTAFAALLLDISKGSFPRDATLPLKSTSDGIAAYNFLWRWIVSGNTEYVDLDRILICSTKSWSLNTTRRHLICSRVPWSSCDRPQAQKRFEERYRTSDYTTRIHLPLRSNRSSTTWTKIESWYSRYGHS